MYIERCLKMLLNNRKQISQIFVWTFQSTISCNKFVQPLYKIDNVVTITRARRNKAIYKKYVDKKEGSGRKRHYGEKNKLNNPDSLPTPDFAEEFEEVLKNSSIQTVRLSIYEVIFAEEVKIIKCHM